MRTGRNEPCPCGSGKKYKSCCLIKPASSIQYKLIAGAGGIVLLICIVLLISSIRNFEPGSANRVWSEEHQHWHYQ